MVMKPSCVFEPVHRTRRKSGLSSATVAMVKWMTDAMDGAPPCLAAPGRGAPRTGLAPDPRRPCLSARRGGAPAPGPVTVAASRLECPTDLLLGARVSRSVRSRPAAAPVAGGPPVAVLQRRTLAVVAVSTLVVLAAFVTPLATSVATAAELGTGPGGQAWLLSAMSVGLAAALLVTGAAADDFGRRRVFTAGLVLLAAGAALIAAAGS